MINTLEADLIDQLFARGVPRDGGRHGDRGRDLRLHVAGEFADEVGARRIADAGERYMVRGGEVVWAPTHRRNIPRDVFGPIELMISCEKPLEVEEALDLGFAAPTTVRRFPNGSTPFTLPGTRCRCIPCPEQAMGRTSCVECRLCLDTDLLRGRDADRARRHLPVLAG